MTGLLPLDDDYVYKLEDLFRPLLREGMQRARHNHQMLAREKLIGIEAAIVTFAKALGDKDAAAEAAAAAAAAGRVSQGNGSVKGTAGKETFPS